MGIPKIYLFFVMWLCSPMVLAGQWPTAKPQSPIAMDFVMPDVIEPGTNVSFVLQVISKVNASHFFYTINLPVDVDRLAGKVYWQGKLRANEMSTFPLTVRLPASLKQPLTANAVMQTIDGVKYGANAVFLFPSMPRQFKSQASNHQRVQRDGRTVIEHSLN